MTLEQFAEKLVGNWKKFDSFGWWGEPAQADQCAIIYTHNRDSGPLDLSNAAIIAKALEPFGDAIPQRHNHFAVGWVEGFVIRVYRRGKITDAFKAYYELNKRMDDYPVLDEEDFSRRESEAQGEAYENCYRQDFARECEKAFDVQLGEITFERFNEIAAENGVYWVGDYIDIHELVELVDYDELPILFDTVAWNDCGEQREKFDNAFDADERAAELRAQGFYATISTGN